MKLNKIYSLYVMFITAVVIIELYYVPHSGYKALGVFPTVLFWGYSFYISELFIISFIAFGTFTLLLKIIHGKNLYTGLKGFNYPVVIFAIALLASVFLGLFNSNENIITHMRTMLFPLLLYPIFLNLSITEVSEKNVFKIIFIGLLIIVLFNVMLFFNSDFIKNIYPPLEILSWYTSALTILVFCISVARLSYHKFSMLWFLLSLFSFLSIAVYLFKPVMWGLLVAIFILVFVGIYNKFTAIVKICVIGIALALCVLLFVINLPDTIIDEMTHVIATSYHKPHDYSGGRFIIWHNYIKESLAGFGVSPKGFGNEFEIDIRGVNRFYEAHNIIIYYAYNSGIVAAISLFIIILIFIKRGYHAFSKNKNNVGIWKYYELLGIYSFLCSVLAINMVNLMIKDLRIAWIFYFLFALTIKKINAIDNAIILESHGEVVSN